MKKISTKLYIYMCALTAAVLAFVGVTLIINITLEYYRGFERSVSLVFERDGFLSLDADTDAVYNYIDSQYELLCQSSDKDVYILKDGNIVKSTKTGGTLKMTDNLRAVLSGGKSTPSDITSDALDYAVSVGDGITVYVLDTRAALYDSIREMSFLFAQALMLGILLALLLGFFISKHLTRPIKTLTNGARRMSDGEFVKVKVTSNDEIGNLCSVFNDMSEQIQKDFDEFERVENSRREFVANVSHELKTPLTVIKSYSETLTQMPVDTGTQKKFLSVIASETDNMSRIVGQLIALSGLENKVGTEKKISLDGLCRQILSVLEIETARKSISVSLTGSAEAVTDPEKTETILTNLITNAVKYTEDGGKITVTVTGGEHPAVSVLDDGIGIDSSDLEHIFERFYRTDKARNRKTGGSGLGLAIAKECADSIGARLSVKSELHKFTEFTLTF